MSVPFFPSFFPYGYYWLGDRHFYVATLAGRNIDEFARTLLHENRHLTDWLRWWGPGLEGYDPLQDLDGDFVPDRYEEALNLNPNLRLTNYPCPRRSVDDFDWLGIPAENAWVAGSADHEDWANPGRQSGK